MPKLHEENLIIYLWKLNPREIILLWPRKCLPNSFIVNEEEGKQTTIIWNQFWTQCVWQPEPAVVLPHMDTVEWTIWCCIWSPSQPFHTHYSTDWDALSAVLLPKIKSMGMSAVSQLHSITSRLSDLCSLCHRILGA